MSLFKRLAVAVLIMGVVMGAVHLAGDPGPAPAAARADLTHEARDRPSDQLEQGSQLGPKVPAVGTRSGAKEPRASSRRPGSDEPQGPSVFPRPPASLDGVPLTARRWVMPMAPRSYRVGCAWACYISDSGLPHTGQDFPAAEGTPVRSIGAGVVIRSESIYVDGGEKAYCPTLPICGSDWTSYGNFIQIQDAVDPSLTVWYAHLATRSVAAGTRVATGQLIGTSGNVGNSEGPHLHFEIRLADRAEDPIPLLRSRGAAPLPGPVPAPPPEPAP